MPSPLVAARSRVGPLNPLVPPSPGELADTVRGGNKEPYTPGDPDASLCSRGSFGKVYIVRFSYPSFELARWRNSVHSASRVTLVRVYAGHAAGRDLGAAAALLI